MTREEKIKKSGTAEMARLLKPLYCSNCCRYVHKECPSTNRDNSCWAVILDWLRGRSGTMNRYSWWTPDFQHEYFVLRINNRETAGYAIYDEKGKRVDNNRQFADDYETAEEAQAALDSMAAERRWVKA